MYWGLSYGRLPDSGLGLLQGLPDTRETRQFAAELLARVPRKAADKVPLT